MIVGTLMDCVVVFVLAKTLTIDVATCMAGTTLAQDGFNCGGIRYMLLWMCKTIVCSCSLHGIYMQLDLKKKT